MLQVKSQIESLEAALVGATPSECLAVIGELERLKAALLMQMLNGSAHRHEPTAAPEAGRYLSADEAAALFHVSTKWLYRNKKRLPHSQPSRKVLLFPEQPLRRWFAARKTG